jgi:hypothetical protein
MNRSRRSVHLALALLPIPLLVLSGSCHRAELDLSRFARSSPEGGDSSSSVPPGSGGSGGVPCDESPLDDVQEDCRQGALPTRADCSEQDVQGWSGCYAGGCAVCTKAVVGYPYYFDRHPCCESNDTCNSNDPKKCNARCPAPTERDKWKPCFVIEL